MTIVVCRPYRLYGHRSCVLPQKTDNIWVDPQSSTVAMAKSKPSRCSIHAIMCRSVGEKGHPSRSALARGAGRGCGSEAGWVRRAGTSPRADRASQARDRCGAACLRESARASQAGSWQRADGRSPWRTRRGLAGPRGRLRPSSRAGDCAAVAEVCQSPAWRPRRPQPSAGLRETHNRSKRAYCHPVRPLGRCVLWG